MTNDEKRAIKQLQEKLEKIDNLAFSIFNQTGRKDSKEFREIFNAINTDLRFGMVENWQKLDRIYPDEN